MATEKFVVTGAQALRISNAQAELNRQLFLQRETKLNPEQVIVTLQGMTEGKLIPFGSGLRGKFIRTMSVQIGGVSKLELSNQVRAVRELDSYARGMMRHECFTTLPEPETVMLIELTPADLGFTEAPTWSEFSDSKYLTAWSQANFDGYIVELNSAEVGPHLAIQYLNQQPNDEALWIVMETISDSSSFPHVFVVERSDRGSLWLNGGYVSLDYHFDPGHRFLFRLREVS